MDDNRFALSPDIASPCEGLCRNDITFLYALGLSFFSWELFFRISLSFSMDFSQDG